MRIARYTGRGPTYILGNEREKKIHTGMLVNGTKKQRTKSNSIYRAESKCGTC